MSSRVVTVRPSWGELSRFADHHERGELLLEWSSDLTDDDHWRAVADVWVDCDRQSITPAEWRDLWLADRPGREHTMTNEERAALAALPERVAVYRGVDGFTTPNGRRGHGLSWTLDRDLAHWFADRGGGGRLTEDDSGGFVQIGHVLRHRIMAFLRNRNESEIVVLPKYIYARSDELFDPDRVARHLADREARHAQFIEDFQAERRLAGGDNV